MDNLKKIRYAWKNAPAGAITKVYKIHSQQNVSHILKFGRKDETIIKELLLQIKIASAEVYHEVRSSNRKIQKL